MAFASGLKQMAERLGVHLPVLRPKNRYGVVVKGTYDPDVLCTSSCKRARGIVCICSCAGGNHGTEG